VRKNHRQEIGMAKQRKTQVKSGQGSMKKLCARSYRTWEGGQNGRWDPPRTKKRPYGDQHDRAGNRRGSTHWPGKATPQGPTSRGGKKVRQNKKTRARPLKKKRDDMRGCPGSCRGTKQVATLDSKIMGSTNIAGKTQHDFMRQRHE